MLEKLNKAVEHLELVVIWKWLTFCYVLDFLKQKSITSDSDSETDDDEDHEGGEKTVPGDYDEFDVAVC